MSISTRTRFEIFKRDKFTCQYCGSFPPNVLLHIDHILAISNGGTDQTDNLITACSACNLGKSNVPMARILAPVSKIDPARKEKLLQLRAYNRWQRSLRDNENKDVRRISDEWMLLKNEDPTKWVIGNKYEKSVRCFLRSLPAEKIIEALHLAHNRFDFVDEEYKTFKYFCGICWRKIKHPEVA